MDTWIPILYSSITAIIKDIINLLLQFYLLNNMDPWNRGKKTIEKNLNGKCTLRCRKANNNLSLCKTVIIIYSWGFILCPGLAFASSWRYDTHIIITVRCDRNKKFEFSRLPERSERKKNYKRKREWPLVATAMITRVEPVTL